MLPGCRAKSLHVKVRCNRAVQHMHCVCAIGKAQSSLNITHLICALDAHHVHAAPVLWLSPKAWRSGSSGAMCALCSRANTRLVTPLPVPPCTCGAQDNICTLKPCWVRMSCWRLHAPSSPQISSRSLLLQGVIVHAHHALMPHQRSAYGSKAADVGRREAK